MGGGRALQRRDDSAASLDTVSSYSTVVCAAICGRGPAHVVNSTTTARGSTATACRESASGPAPDGQCPVIAVQVYPIPAVPGGVWKMSRMARLCWHRGRQRLSGTTLR